MPANRVNAFRTVSYSMLALGLVHLVWVVEAVASGAPYLSQTIAAFFLFLLSALARLTYEALRELQVQVEELRTDLLAARAR